MMDLARFDIIRQQPLSHSSLHNVKSEFFRTETDEYNVVPDLNLAETRTTYSVEDDVTLLMFEAMLNTIVDDWEGKPCMKQVRKPLPPFPSYCDVTLSSGVRSMNAVGSGSTTVSQDIQDTTGSVGSRMSGSRKSKRLSKEKRTSKRTSRVLDTVTEITSDLETIREVRKPLPPFPSYCDVTLSSDVRSMNAVGSGSTTVSQDIQDTTGSVGSRMSGSRKSKRLSKEKRTSKRTSRVLDTVTEITSDLETIREPPVPVTDSIITSGTQVSAESLPEWKIPRLDEEVTIHFQNGAIYMGRVSRKKMDGSGLYRWPDGMIYEGDFVDNLPHGNGVITWPDMSFYEGTVYQGMRHGSGFFTGPPVGVNEHRVYISGIWEYGTLHGKAVIKLGDQSYEGEFAHGTRTGFATRFYDKENAYSGNFVDGMRSGKGTMVWSNNDMYNGDWENGKKEGYGEYTWNSFRYPELCFFGQDQYFGYWSKDMRHGFGTLTLAGGGLYDGNWSNNLKNGMGLVVCKNGLIIRADKLYVKNKEAPVVKEKKPMSAITTPSSGKKRSKKDSSRSGSNKQSEKQSQFSGITCSPHKYAKYEDRMMAELEKHVFASTFVKSNDNCRPRSIPLHLPDHHIILDYHLDRLLSNNSYQSKFKNDNMFRLSYDCMSACQCPPLESSSSNVFNLNSACGSLAIKMKINIPSKSVKSVYNEKKENATFRDNEEYFLRNMITYHILQLREIYETYAAIALRDDYPMNSKPVLVRLYLWQLFRDCSLHERGICLAKLDRSIAQNAAACVLYEHAPFERLQFYQFVHIVLEVSWILYGQYMNPSTTERGVLATSFDQFITQDIMPNINNHNGSVLFYYRDFLPIPAIYELYQDIEVPVKVRSLIKIAHEKSKLTEEEIDMPPLLSGSKQAASGNHNVIGDRCVFMAGDAENIFQDSITRIPAAICKVNLGGFKALEELPIIDIINCCTEICPSIMDENTIVNVDYELTFLEFYEILLLCVDKIFYNIDYAAWEKLEKARIDKLNKLIEKPSGKSKGKGKDKKKK